MLRFLSVLMLFLAIGVLHADDGVAYFEKHIRPVLIERCYSCHSSQSKSVKGGLLLDSKAGLIKGGDSGSALNLQEPHKSLLLEVLKYDGDIKMPPQGKLPEQTIKHFEAKGTECYYREDNGKYLVYRTADNKTLKSVFYSPADLEGVLAQK